MPRKLTPDEFADLHAKRLKASKDEIVAGLEAVTVSPTAKAATKIDKMKAHLDEAFSSGLVKKRLEAVTLDQWKNQALTKGVKRISEGIDGAREKVKSFASELLPKVYSLSDEINKMPDMTIEDSIARAEKFIREMSKFRKSK